MGGGKCGIKDSGDDECSYIFGPAPPAPSPLREMSPCDSFGRFRPQHPSDTRWRPTMAASHLPRSQMRAGDDFLLLTCGDLLLLTSESVAGRCKLRWVHTSTEGHF